MTQSGPRHYPVEESGTASVLIIDDHPIVLQAIRRLLEDAGTKTVLVAQEIATGYRLFLRHKPEVVIVDLAMKGVGLGGLALIRRIRIRNLGTRILAFSMHSDPIIVARVLEAGATGFVLKDTSPQEFIEAFQQVRAGGVYLTTEMAVQVAFVQTGVPHNPLNDLTSRELETLALLAQGKAYGSITEELNVSYKTVVNTCSNLKQKLDARNLGDLIRIAVKLLANA